MEQFVISATEFSSETTDKNNKVKHAPSRMTVDVFWRQNNKSVRGQLLAPLTSPKKTESSL